MSKENEIKIKECLLLHLQNYLNDHVKFDKLIRMNGNNSTN